VFAFSWRSIGEAKYFPAASLLLGPLTLVPLMRITFVNSVLVRKPSLSVDVSPSDAMRSLINLLTSLFFVPALFWPPLTTTFGALLCSLRVCLELKNESKEMTTTVSESITTVRYTAEGFVRAGFVVVLHRVRNPCELAFSVSR